MNPSILKAIPQELKDLMGFGQEEETSRLAVLGLAIANLRDEAVRGRKMSGIEDTWLLAEEAYLGMDDLNRSEFMAGRWAKPTTMDGPLTRNTGKDAESTGATVFIPLTARYVDAGSAKVSEITISPDDRSFSIEPTPVPDLIDNVDNHEQVIDPQTNQPAFRKRRPDEMPKIDPNDPNGAVNQGVAAQQSEPVPLTYADLAREKMDEAEKRAESAENRIADWMIEAKHSAEMRKLIFDASRIGVGVLKGPYPDLSRSISGKKTEAGFKVTIDEVVKPSEKWVDPWNLFPDPSCGEDIHQGNYIFERAFMTRKGLAQLKGKPGYIDANIDRVLEEGPTKPVFESSRNPSEQQLRDDTRFEVWYFNGMVKRSELVEAGAPGVDPADEGEADREMHAIVTIINAIVVKATVNPLDSGRYPYHAMPWRRRVGHWAGVGVAEQVRAAQRMCNAVTRAMLNNAGKSSGSQIVINTNTITPAVENDWRIYADKIWLYQPDAAVGSDVDVEKAFQVFEIPNRQSELMPIIEYSFRVAEESCNIPLISQGQSGKTTPQTLGATQLQDNNANQLLRAIGYTLDDTITEPLVTMYYEYLLLDPEIPEDEKGDKKINANGSSALVERAIQQQVIGGMAPMATNPAFGINPKLFVDEYLKSQKLDPRKFKYTKEELAKTESQPPPKAPAVEAAEIRAKSASEIAAIGEQGDNQRAKMDTDRDTVYAQAEARRVEIEREFRMGELKVRREIAMVEYANKREMKLEDVKLEMAKVTEQETTKRTIAAAEIALAEKRHATPSADKSLIRDEISTDKTP